MTVSTAVTDQRGYMKVKVTGVAAATAGGIGSILNPEGVLLALPALLYTSAPAQPAQRPLMSASAQPP